MLRTKLLAVLLFSLLSVVLSNRLFPAFVTTGQTGGLSAPTGLVASDSSYSTKVGLTWNAVRGATTYRIFRNTIKDSAGAVSVGTTPAGEFFDATAVAGQNYFYWVRAENGTTTSALSAPDQGMRAIGNIVGPIQPLNPPPMPPGNPVTAAKAYLGKALFWDEQLSSTRTVACGTCHFATSGGSDPRAIVNNARSTNPGADGVFNTPDDVFASPGVPSNNVDGTYNWHPQYGFREQVTGRKSRSYVDASYSQFLFWDGRATPVFSDPISGAVVLQNGAALESQVLGPPVNSAEMAHSFRDWNDVANRVSVSSPLALTASMPTGLRDWIGERNYPDLFAEAFGSPEVTPARIAMAIATFERTVYSDRTPFDAAVSQIAPLTQAEARGQAVFNQSQCNVCHAGTLFSDDVFHNIGLRPQNEDTGRFQVTGNPVNIGEFRTPSLRNVQLRGPYMHNGHFATLEEVVEFYNRGGDFNASNINHNLIRPLNLTPQQEADLLAFLRRPLTDPRVASATAPFDRPTLYSETNRVPQIIGTGTAGSVNAIPEVTAIDPPITGNPSFTVAVSNALGGAQAVLVVDSNDAGSGPYVPPTGSLARVSLQLSGSGAGQGFGSVSLQIPNTSALIGSNFFGRWYVIDSNAAGGVAATPAFKMTVFGPAGSTDPTTNPIDDARTFVRQNYLDFLGREPEAGGWDYWTAQFDECNQEPACIRQKRIDVSAAFFISAESQQSGAFIYQMYAGALGRAPGYNEFTPDRAQVIGGAGLEQAKIAFAEAFVQRSEFTSRYPLTMTRDQFVDALLATMTQRSGADLSSLRSAMLSDYDNGGRSLALRNAVQASAFAQAEYNKAFVLMEYYGYMRREVDQGGYAYWLDVLNNGGAGNYRGMVCAFLTSSEYQLRFGIAVTHSNAECS
jgi:cytochrome c peroxidase